MRGWIERRPHAVAVLAAAWFALLALVVPVNHDEDQYVGGVAMVLQGLHPYADFAHLQTPLQLWLFAPAAWVAGDWSFVAQRLLTAALALGAILLVYAAQRRLGVERGLALLCATAMAGTATFLFCASVVRNDMLPALLLAAAILALAGWEVGGERSRWRLAAAGLLLGLATSTKVSFAPALGLLGLWLLGRWLLRRGRGRFIDGLAYAAGGLAGLVPAAVGYALHPANFVYGVLVFGEAGPDYWYRLAGQAHRLTLEGKAWATLRDLGRGTAWVALGVLTLAIVRRKLGAVRLGWLDVLLVAGLIGALLPTPTWRQYFIVLLPPLYVRLGLHFALHPPGRPLRWGLIAASTAVAAYFLVDAALDARGRLMPAAARVTAEAHWIGGQVAHAGSAGPVAGFSAHLLADTGRPIDPRFATGVFLFRSGDQLDDATLRRLRGLSWRTLDAELDGAPPAAIVTGYEGRSSVQHVSPDAALEAWAARRGYARHASPVGSAVLWIRPSPSRR